MRALLPALLPALLCLAVACGDKEDDDTGAEGADGTSADGADGTSADGSDGTQTGSEYGPDNAWPHAQESDVPDDLEGTGRGVGDVMPNFTLIDQNGDEVELYQFYGNVVQLVLFAEWCGPCNQEAPDIEAASRNLADGGVVILSVMFEDDTGGAPDAAALSRWVSAYDVTHPLLAGPGNLSDSIQGGYPTLPVLNRDMTIATVDNYPFSEATLASIAAE